MAKELLKWLGALVGVPVALIALVLVIGLIYEHGAPARQEAIERDARAVTAAAASARKDASARRATACRDTYSNECSAYQMREIVETRRDAVRRLRRQGHSVRSIPGY